MKNSTGLQIFKTKFDNLIMVDFNIISENNESNIIFAKT